MDGLTFPVEIPYRLEVLYRKDIWNELISYYEYNLDLPHDCLF